MDLNLRMKLGDTESNFAGSFMPITPGKTITADSTRISMNGHGSQLGRENWEEFSGFSNPNYDTGSYTQELQNESVDWNGSFLSLLEMGNDTDDFLLANQTHSSNSNILAGIPQYGFPVPYTSQYDLNSLPSMETYGASSVANLSQFEPATPNAKWTNEREKPQHNLHISVPSENHVDISSEIISLLSEEPKDPVVSTSIEEPKDSGILSEEVIDLNQTPQAKTPKRRKHRPKVIVEGKSKRTPKEMKTADPEKKASEKRKYVRKVQQETETLQPDSAEKPKEKRKYVRKDLKEPAAEISEPSCKKSLNFDSENAISGREKNLVSQLQLLNKEAEISKLSAEFRVTDPIKPTDIIGRREPSLPKNQQNELISNLAPSMNLMADNIASNSGRRPDLNASTRDTNFTSQQFLSSDRAGQMLFHFNPQSQFLPYLDESRRSKREYYQIGTNSHHGQKMYHTDGYHLNSSIPNDAYLETRKKKKIENGNITNNGGMSRFVTAVDHSRSSTGRNNVSSVASASQRNSDILGLNLNMNNVRREINESIRIPVHSSTHSVVSGQDKPKQNMHRSEENFRAIMLQTIASANTFMACNMIPPTPRASSRHQDTWQHTNSNINLSRRQEIVPMRKPEMQVFNDGQSPGRRKGQAAKQKFLVTVEEIIYKMESLNINETNALVPFKGDGSLIPYEGIFKKRKPRPKVDLDSETERVWNLLMWKEGTEDQGTDEEKRKWWDEERRVFRGRADSFIARMHLVQGDRRFSKWKGSVVDSVIGVFLTQNVSDHLSSSAFMSLAARFPPKPTTGRTCQRDGAIVLVEEPDTGMPNLSEKLQEKLLRHPFYAHSSMTPYGLEEQQLESETSCTERTGRLKGYTHSPEEVLSSQDSLDSSVSQSIGLRSYSGSNSEAEEPTNVNKYNKNHSSSSVDLRVESATFAEFYSNISGISLFPEESRRPEYSQKVSSTFNPQISHSNLLMQILTIPSGNYTTSHSGVLEAESLNSHREESISSWPSGPSSIVQGAENVVRITSSRSSNEPVNLADEQATRQFASNIPTGKFSNGAENKSVESGSNDPVTDKVNSNVKTINAKKEKGKANGEKKDTFDWDSLRKQVLGNSESKGKNKDAMDSLDYEAMRSASVNQISDTIRERGMNNMLAERIKEFLDRLVRDHGSVDLEWLRDVPPYKAKEYLLSIRGLGLKSVECVRLLTLHHLAFPVDTNVGRIAVRLGWVPLQPLPESLQLHLLELYPILESIQKYLWPRLCKLDQRTLYELHYQMITFGKVFCTKSRPNCNACPMRAECRHFASAFASARLALPGPEEKSIVTHTAPLTTKSGPGIIIDPMPLPPPEENKLQTGIVSCVPIIEEPATPEQEQIEVLESEIEDFFNDETDEIPTIKLNMEELSVNLQNYMQENMDLQEFDVSKALVALNPNAASIPTPKLKYVSRLRTEHNVYELPDSHPLLNGMDKREPDDPSPYLLAIWTPGETAESIQPPGKQCQSQESGILCNEKTCFSCNSIREANSQIVRGTLLIPCRTAMRGSFPLNGTYFQVNEMFADHASSVNPIDVPRAWIWNLPRRMVYFGTSVSTIFKGLSTEEIQYCFWRGFVCVRGFDQKSRAPRPLLARLHFPASKLAKTKNAA